ncbi:hypothetical protein RIR_jg8760.t1 [Rhizophagus irregularis DAOM 181602=DAOM 197198]|nr:hypothetical protein RIR_jg8760.t1 [Rhizophagus irregularis DAOM 181602=DAOM 197198]
MSCAFLVFNFLLRHLPNGFSLHLSSPYDSFGLLRAETSVYFKRWNRFKMRRSVQNPKTREIPKIFHFDILNFRITKCRIMYLQDFEFQDFVPTPK